MLYGVKKQPKWKTKEKPFKPVSCKTKGEAKQKKVTEADGGFGQSQPEIKGRNVILQNQMQVYASKIWAWRSTDCTSSMKPTIELS